MTVRSLRVRDIFVTASQFSLSWPGMTDTQISLRCRSCALSPLLTSPLSLSPPWANRASEHPGSAATLVSLCYYDVPGRPQVRRAATVLICLSVCQTGFVVSWITTRAQPRVTLGPNFFSSLQIVHGSLSIIVLSNFKHLF